MERGYEGYVAKSPASAYKGGRTRRWLKVKGVGGPDAEDGGRRVRTAPAHGPV
jgi:ATP-dependent DNA ligase